MLKRAATTSVLKELNAETVMEAIRRRHPISRAEVARWAGISKPTVSRALQALLDAGLVREALSVADAANYGALYFEPVPEAALVLGLDIGARFIRAAVADLGGEVRARTDLEIREHDRDTLCDQLAAVRDTVLDAADLAGHGLDQVVIGVPGVPDPATGRIRESGIRPLEGFPVGSLSEALGPWVSVENDVNLAALGEQWRGAGQGVGDFAFLSVGSGVGAGLVLNGELYRGHRGAAGEVDYPGEGREHDPGSPAADALLDMAEARRARFTGATSLTRPLSPEAIFAAARAGDPLAAEIIADEAARVATCIRPLVQVTDVELVVLGGGIGLNGDLLLEPVRAALARTVPHVPRLEISALGDAPVLTGALAVGVRGALASVVSRRLKSQAS